MATVKYTRLPMADSEDNLSFDFSSAFTFEERDISQLKYKSAFTYGRSKEQTARLDSKEEISDDKYVRLLVTLGFLVVYIFAFPLMVWFSFKKIPHNERLVVFRLGRLHKMKGPGIVFLLPVLDRCHKIDVRLRAFSVPPKQVITGDGAIIEVGAEIYFQIVDAEKSVTNVQNLDQSTRILLQTGLCNIMVQKSLADIEAERRTIAETLMINSNKASMEWGVEITRVELSQIKVLSEAPQKRAPTVVKPPGLFGAQANPQAGMTAVFAQLAAALGTSQDQSGALSQALHSMASAGLAPNSGGTPTTVNTNDLTTLLGSRMLDGNSSATQQFVPTPVESAAAGDALIPPPPQHTASAVPLIPVTPSSPALRPEDILEMIRGALCDDVVRKVGETYQFEISGTGTGTYFLDLQHADGSIGEGPDPSGDPSAILSLTFDDLQAMLLGELQPFQAYMSGRLRVSGDTSAALKLEHLGKRIQSLAYARQPLI